MQRKENQTENMIKSLILETLKMSEGNYQRLTEEIEGASVLGNLGLLVKNLGQGAKDNKKGKKKGKRGQRVKANFNKDSFDYKILELMIMSEGLILSSQKKLKQKYNFLGQNNSKIRKEIKVSANKAFEDILGQIQSKFIVCNLVPGRELTEIITIENFINFFAKSYKENDPRVINIQSHLESFLITLITLSYNNDQKGDSESEKLGILRQAAIRCLSIYYSKMNEKSLKNILKGLVVNINIFLNLMTFAVKNEAEFSCREQVDSFANRYQYEKNRTSETRYLSYVKDYILLKDSEDLKFKHFMPQIINDMVQLLILVIGQFNLKGRFKLAFLFEIVEEIVNVDMSEVEYDDENTLILNQTRALVCNLVSSIMTKFPGSHLNLFKIFLIRTVEMKFYTDLDFLKNFVSLIMTHASKIPVCYHLSVLLDDPYLFSILSKLMLWNPEMRNSLETDHHKLKKTKQIQLFKRERLTWIENILQESDEKEIYKTRLILIKYIHTLSKLPSFLNYLSEKNFAKIQSGVKSEFLDKVRLQFKYSSKELNFIREIIENFVELRMKKDGFNIIQKDFIEDSISYLKILDALIGSKGKSNLDVQFGLNKIKKLNNFVSERSSVLGKRQMVDEYLETYLKEYSVKARKMLKIQMMENMAKEERDTNKEEKKEESTNGQDWSFKFTSAAQNIPKKNSEQKQDNSGSESPFLKRKQGQSQAGEEIMENQDSSPSTVESQKSKMEEENIDFDDLEDAPELNF